MTAATSDSSVTHVSIDTGGGYTVGRFGKEQSVQDLARYHGRWAQGYAFVGTPEPTGYVIQYPYGDPTGHSYTLNEVAREMIIALGGGDPGLLHGIVDFTSKRSPFGPMERDEVYRLKRLYVSAARKHGINTSIDPDADLWPNC